MVTFRPLECQELVANPRDRLPLTQMSDKISSICVFCGSQSGTKPEYEAAARHVGRSLAERNIRLVYGGGSVGLMGAVADACLEAGGEVIGVITSYLMDKELGHPGITKLEVVNTMLDRKLRMAELSNAFLTLPGGIGTLDELFEMLTWSRLNVHDKPSGLVNVDGYYDELISFALKTQVEGGFISAEDALNLLVAESFEDLLPKLEQASQSLPSSRIAT